MPTLIPRYAGDVTTSRRGERRYSQRTHALVHSRTHAYAEKRLHAPRISMPTHICSQVFFLILFLFFFFHLRAHYPVTINNCYTVIKTSHEKFERCFKLNVAAHSSQKLVDGSGKTKTTKKNLKTNLNDVITSH